MDLLRVFCAVLAFVLIAVACGGSDSAEPASTTAAEAATTEAPVETTPPATEAPAATEPPVTEAPATTAAPEPAGTTPDYDFSAVGPIVQTFVDDNELNGAGLIVVHKDHGVIHHEQWGEFTEDRISLVASSSKMVTAGVLLHLQDEGLLDIDAPIAETVEWGSANPEITTAQLLSNSSGLLGLFTGINVPSYLCQYDYTSDLQECAEQIFTTPDDDADIIAPDTAFDYGGAQWQIAGAVAEVASGKSWDDLITEIYSDPCELETLAFNNHFGQLGSSGFDYPTDFTGDPAELAETTNPNMEGGMYTTTSDYAKLMLMHLRGGMCGDEQVLSQEALDLVHADRVAEVYDGQAFDAGTGYGMGWWVDRATGRLTDGGAYGSHPWLDLEDGYGAFLVIEASSALGNQLGGLLYDVVEAEATK